MKYRRCLWTLLVAVVLLSSLGSSESRAQSWVFYSPRGPILNPPAVQPYPMYTWQYNYPMYPAYNPYVAPYPAYAILPPPFLTTRTWTTHQEASPYSNGKTAEDYGYTPDQFDQQPRKRNALSPALPFKTGPQQKEEDRFADARRVRIEVTTPTADATVLIDGAKTRQAGTQRVFVTPPLDDDRLYTLTVDVVWTDDNGKQHKDSKTYECVAGETLHYPLTKLK